MAFTRVRTINGKQYLYEETRWREGGKVRSSSVSLGPVGGEPKVGWLRRQMGQSIGINWEKIEEEMHARQIAEQAAQKARADELYSLYGMTLGPAIPVEVEKRPSMVDLNSPAATPQDQEKAPPEGEADGSSETQDQ